MSRRRAGIAGLRREQQRRNKLKSTGQELNDEYSAHISDHLRVFKDKLQDFAVEHKEDIVENPQFRYQFNKICGSLGVDIIAHSQGMFASMLGMGNFYYELAVQIITVCLDTRQQNGGIVDLDLLINMLNERRSKTAQAISKDDIKRAIKSVSDLNGEFKIVELNGKEHIVSVPLELSTDTNVILGIAEARNGRVSQDDLRSELKWNDVERINRAIMNLANDGFLWVDKHHNIIEYVFPAFDSEFSF
ncbi:hypothetical protein PCE1_004295 [Barthelona sp. PCE]